MFFSAEIKYCIQLKATKTVGWSEYSIETNYVSEAAAYTLYFSRNLKKSKQSYKTI